VHEVALIPEYPLGLALELPDPIAGECKLLAQIIDADSGCIYGWSVDAEGALEPIGSWGGLPATVAGLAAS
jgi:hypothetical protein